MHTAINNLNRATNNYKYRISILFDIYLEQIITLYEHNICRSFVSPLIVHLFHQQHDYIVNGNIISDMIKFREIINLTTKEQLFSS